MKALCISLVSLLTDTGDIWLSIVFGRRGHMQVSYTTQASLFIRLFSPSEDESWMLISKLYFGIGIRRSFTCHGIDHTLCARDSRNIKVNTRPYYAAS